ncbi:alkane hydroxylase MAH1-like [Olea europaea var. sylvestris]|uniref:alkane hydroxylase MAH1-like n=1 Tax=Olea europaea var. sylvestris TaxID=158386 RepID=UPI000C1CFD9F|nr:alkane hydroxylase MAH1-like [Olea europaea var. sylvestris]
MLAILNYTEILFFVLLFTLLYFRNFNSKRKGSALPTNWPVLGMMPAVIVNAHRFHDYLTELLEITDTFWFKGLWFTNSEILLTSDPANVHYILSKNFPNFTKGPEFKKIFDILGDGIFNAESESWKNQRRTVMSLINHHKFQKFVATISQNKVEEGLIPVLENAAKMGKEVDMQELFQRFTFDSACIMVLGHDPASLCIDLPHLPYEKAFADAEEALLYRHILPETYWKLEKWLNLGKEKKLSEAKDTVNQFLMHCISLKRQKVKSIDQISEHENEDFAFLTSYMKAVEENGDAPDHISDNVWKDTMLNLIFAGKDTISAALTWFFWLLSTNPIEEKKIREEIKTNLQVNEKGKWKFSNTEELKKLVYLHGALCESLRLFPPVALQHKAPIKPDILPSGHQIKPNMKTVLSFYSMGRMVSIWGKDCLQFKPERWISEQGRIKHEPSFKFTAFNAGPRSCLGKEMTFIQMKIVAASIINSYHFQVVKGPIAPSNSVVLHMKHGMKVTVSKLFDES